MFIQQGHSQHNHLKNVHNIQQLYKQITIDNKIPFNQQFFDGLKNQDLKLNINKLFQTDIQIFQFILENIQFQVISLNGQNYTKHQIQYLKNQIRETRYQNYFSEKNSPLQYNKNDFLNILKEIQNKNLIFSHEDHTDKLFRSVSQNLAISIQLQQISISYINISKASCQMLSDALPLTTSLKELSIQNCNLENEHIKILQHGLSIITSIVLLDLSFNKIQNPTSIGKVLSAHGTRRNNLLFNVQLRNCRVEDDLALMGLCEVNLQDNLIDDEGIKAFCFYLRQDVWTRVKQKIFYLQKCINLKNNKFGAKSYEWILDVIQNNTQIISFDLRDNQDLTDEIKFKVTRKILDNIKLIKKPNQNQNGQSESQNINNEEIKQEIYYEALAISGLDHQNLQTLCNLQKIVQNELDNLNIKLEKSKTKKRKQYFSKQIEWFKAIQEQFLNEIQK